MSFGPDGTAYQVSLSFNANDTTRTPFSRARSTDGGDTWSEPGTIIRDSGDRDSSYAFNDKESVTADPTKRGYAYAVWDRFVTRAEPRGQSIEGLINSRSFREPIWFSRTTDGGQTWEPARNIYDRSALERHDRQPDPGGEERRPAGLLRRVLRPQELGRAARREHVGHPLDGQGRDVVEAVDGDRSEPGDRRLRSRTPAGRSAPRAGCPRSRSIARAARSTPSGRTRASAAWTRSRSRCPPTTATPGRCRSRSTRHRAAATAADQQAFVAGVHVAANGTVAVTYYDFRNNDAGTGVPTDYWIVHCHADCTITSSWSGNENRLTTDVVRHRAGTGRTRPVRLLPRRVRGTDEHRQHLRARLRRREQRQPGKQHGRVLDKSRLSGACGGSPRRAPHAFVEGVLRPSCARPSPASRPAPSCAPRQQSRTPPGKLRHERDSLHNVRVAM